MMTLRMAPLLKDSSAIKRITGKPQPFSVSWLGIDFLVLRRISDLSGRTVHHFDRASADAAVIASTAVSSYCCGGQSLFQPFLRQTVAGLNIG
jgi:hypothetical protein